MVHHRLASDRHHGVMIFTMAQELLSFFLTSISIIQQLSIYMKDKSEVYGFFPPPQCAPVLGQNLKLYTILW